MNMAKPRWNEVKEKGGMLPLLIILWLYRLGGRWFIQCILYFIVLWYWIFAAASRKASLDYLQRLHLFAGERSPFTHLPTMTDTYAHLMSFSQSILDKIEGWLGKFSQQDLHVMGQQDLGQYHKKGLILIVSHFGNVELLRAIKSEHLQKINVLVYQKHASKFNQFLQKISDKANINLISVDELGVETAIFLEQKLAQGEWVLIAADRVPIHSNRVLDVDFLGEKALWPQGAWILASMLKVPVVAVFCYRFQKKLEVHIHSMSECLQLPRRTREQALKEITTQYVRLVEQHCLRVPYQWFNFYYFWNK
ncbi:hypothetical protein GCM10027155_13850 [Acinetobacter apis]|nr:acyltransferase [Acinetobacter apis]